LPPRGEEGPARPLRLLISTRFRSWNRPACGRFESEVIKASITEYADLISEYADLGQPLREGGEGGRAAAAAAAASNSAPERSPAAREVFARLGRSRWRAARTECRLLSTTPSSG